MSISQKIALIEIGTSHDECLHAQIAILKRFGIEFHLILSDSVAARATSIEADPPCFIVAEPHGPWARFQTARKIINYLTQHQLRSVVFNTAHGKTIRNVCLMAPRGIRFTGILHAARKALRWSATQRLITSRINHYLVLNDTIRDSLLQSRPTMKVDSFYPVYQPGGPSENSQSGRFSPDRPAVHTEPEDRSAQTLTICIPGPVHQGRRDYDGLLESLGRDQLDCRVQFVLLGQCDNWQQITRQIELLGLRKQFTLYQQFVEQRPFRDVMLRCAAVMPLIHPSTPGFTLYRTLQTSGSFHLAFAYRKPLLMHAAFDDVQDFGRAALFYNHNELVSLLNRLAGDHGPLDQIVQALHSWDKLTLDHQAKTYLKALGIGTASNRGNQERV